MVSKSFRQYLVWGTGPSWVVLGIAFYYWANYMPDGGEGFTLLMLRNALYAGVVTCLLLAVALLMHLRQGRAAKKWLAVTAMCGLNTVCLYGLAFLSS